MLTRWDLVISRFPKAAFSEGQKKFQMFLWLAATTKYCVPFVVILISETVVEGQKSEDMMPRKSQALPLGVGDRGCGKTGVASRMPGVHSDLHFRPCLASLELYSSSPTLCGSHNPSPECQSLAQVRNP